MKVGDIVAVISSYYGRRTAGYETIVRETKLYYVVEDGTKYRKSNGRRVGWTNQFSQAPYLVPTNNEEARELHRQQLLEHAREGLSRAVDNLKRDKLSVDQVEKSLEMYKKLMV